MKKLVSLLLVCAMIFTIFLTGCGNNDSESVAEKRLETKFDLQAHRGGRDARSENTLYSYNYAMETGASTIECDMQLTKDNHIVMWHYPTLTGELVKDKDGKFLTSENEKNIQNLTLDEVKQYDVSSVNPDTEYYKLHGKSQVNPDYAKISTIEELFDLIKENKSDIKVNMEIKVPSSLDNDISKKDEYINKFLGIFNSTIKKYDMGKKVFLQTFDWEAIKVMKKLNNKIKTVALWNQEPSWGREEERLRPYESGASPYLGGLDIDDYKGDVVKAAHDIGADCISPYFEELSAGQVKEAHELKMTVVPWTVNDEESIKSMYYMGVDGLITDRPWIAKEFLESVGEELNQTHFILSKDYHLDTDHNEAGDVDSESGAKR